MNAANSAQLSSDPVRVPLVTSDDFNSQLDVRDGTLQLKLKGNADIRVMFPLETMMNALEQEISRLGIREVVVDLRELEFMNSSCFKTFVTWISAALDSPSPYKVTFRSNQTMLWQRRSLHALSAFATDLIAIETT